MLKVEYISLSEITPYAGNAKMHPAHQIEQIKESIQQFGFNDPLALWHGEIVEGHGRYIAAQELGLSEIPVIRLDGLTDEQRRAYAIVHNKLTINSDFDAQLLDAELSGLPDFDAEFFGFELTDFDFGSDDSYLKEQKEPEAKEGKTTTCPNCGFVFETL